VPVRMCTGPRERGPVAPRRRLRDRFAGTMTSARLPRRRPDVVTFAGDSDTRQLAAWWRASRRARAAPWARQRGSRRGACRGIRIRTSPSLELLRVRGRLGRRRYGRPL